ncbi:LamG-like jellyroll fold domain-containing protein [Roseateles chitinivorans]|nr:LamG-like jellyroll fold domain-containing protein [Roseateles chitinivorans]
MRDQVAAGRQPWLGSWNLLLAARRAELGVKPSPLEVVSRGGTGENFWVMVTDMMRAYHLALRWKVTGDEAYAKDAVKFLNAWSSTLKRLAGDSNRYLASGLYGNQWANAAEVMRSYPGWAKEDVARFQTMLLNVFYPECHAFLTDHNGTEIRKVTHYWANWDLANVCSMYAIGVFCDRSDIVAEASNYYKNGRGCGSHGNNVYYLHPGYLGQWQESHRDQGHSTLGIALAGMLCEMAWNQGEDLYGLWNNRLLAGAEYVAKTNVLVGPPPDYIAYPMPFTPYAGVHGSSTTVSGGDNPRPCWELILNHYVARKGLSAPWTQKMVNKQRPERVDGGDSPGLGSLLYVRDPVAPARPSGLSAVLHEGKVLMSWWGSADATDYLVQRASSSAGPFTTLARVTDPRTYTDAPAAGTWYYRISAVTGQGERVGADTLRVAVPGELWLHLPLNGSTDDLSGNGRYGVLMEGATWGEGRNGSTCVVFDGRRAHVRLVDGVVSALGDYTVAMWVYCDNTGASSRFFDFGSNDVSYMALTPRESTRPPVPSLMRLMSTRNQFWMPSPLAAPIPPNGRWTHVAITLSGTVGTLYVDGSPVATSPEIWMAPYQFGHTTRNWLGRSQYGGDPFFKGRMQDFRIYSGALTAAAVANLAR